MLEYTGDREALNEIVSFVANYRRAFEAGEQWAARGVIELWGGPGAFDAMSPTMRDFIAAGTAQNLRHWDGNFAFRPTLDELRAIQVQTALVHGTSAHWIAKLLVQRLRGTLPCSSVFEISGANHFMLHTHASESARIIGDTLGHA
jgi:pimeloyl-ACP methyl ester carboxylesterase